MNYNVGLIGGSYRAECNKKAKSNYFNDRYPFNSDEQSDHLSQYAELQPPDESLQQERNPDRGLLYSPSPHRQI